MQEIEKKYLLKKNIINLIRNQSLLCDKMTQYYTYISPCKEIRYRKAGKTYYKTIKHGEGIVREEQEKEIPKATFKHKYAKHIRNVIRKDRYYLMQDNVKYIIDHYKKDLKGLFILEIEFPTLSECDAFEIPEYLKPYIQRDVTEDERYKNKNLALWGKPQEKAYDINKIFTQLEKTDEKNMTFDFLKSMSAADAVRTVLYKFYLNIMHYKAQLLIRSEEEDLHQFRINIRKSRTFIKAFGFLFDEKVHAHLNDNLSKAASFTNPKRDLDVIKGRLLELKEKDTHLYSDLDEKIRTEQQKIKTILQSSEFDMICKSYHFFLKENSRFYLSDTAEEDIYTIAEQVITKLHRKIIKRINSLETEFSVQKLHKIRIAFKKLRYLLEEFRYLFDEKRIAKMIGSGKKLQTILGDFNDTVNQKLLLHNYFETHRESLPNSEEKENFFLEQTDRTERALIQKAQKALHKFKQKDFQL